MERIKDIATQYNDGLFTSRECIGQITNVLMAHWERIPEEECSDSFTNQLAKLLVSHEKA